ncbi:MAG: hypothetical protein A2252_11145 [Elusimicrobia bacterium RIFOXYA2_FULL_39_19]|nr:MAG: hypothetical protein A2252_11145 [Elusimicrobia bacterium RIFOXYA2_FULL_39_19]
MKKTTIIAFILLVIQFLLGLDSIRKNSPTYDEPLHQAAGYSYWKTGKYYLNIYDHPPVGEMAGAVPLLFMNPSLPVQHPSWQNYDQYSFADIFLYKNTVDPEKMLNSGRVVILFVTCLLGFVVFLWARTLYGELSALGVLLLYVFSSNILAHGTLVTTDMVFIFFLFLGTYLFWKWLNKPTALNAVYCALATGLAFCSKYSAGIILLNYLLILIIYPGKKDYGRIFKHLLIFASVTFAVMLVVYRFDQINLFFEGIKYLSKQMARGRSSFLFGMYETNGWKYYFLATFLIKTPVPLIILLILSAFFYKKYSKEQFAVLLVPVIVYFTVASFSKVQIGLRHILPIFPFLFVWSGNVIKQLLPVSRLKITGQKFSKIKLLFLLHLLGWYVYSFFTAQPFPISYFNEFAGGPKNGYQCLTDSNVDWGNGLKAMGKWCKANKVEALYFCYFGVGDPQYYGINYVPVGFINNLKPEARPGVNSAFMTSPKTYFAISATNLKATYYADKKTFSFLESYKPEAVFANSILLYDLTDRPEALIKLGDIYGSIGNKTAQDMLYKKAGYRNYSANTPVGLLSIYVV